MLKQCIHCKEFKDEETEFYKQRKRNGKERNTYFTVCKVCYRAQVKANSTPQKRRYHMVKFKFNLSKSEYDALVAEYPVCAICGSEFKENEPHVDHDHTTDKVRALLCGGCNVGLGMFKEDPERLARAIEYLNKFKSLVADCPIAK